MQLATKQHDMHENITEEWIADLQKEVAYIQHQTQVQNLDEYLQASLTVRYTDIIGTDFARRHY